MKGNKQIHTSELKSIGYKARDENSILGSLNLDGQNVRGSCIDISKYIIQRLINRHRIPSDATGGLRCDVRGNEMHYLVYLDLRYIEDLKESEGQLYIDASIDQFCDEQKEIGRVDISLGPYDSIPRVDLLTPSDPSRKRYQNIRHDVLHKTD